MDAHYGLRYFTFAAALLLTFGLGAQNDDVITDGTEAQPFIQPNLPPQSVRTMGEWEEIEGIAIAWDDTYEDILTEIVRYSVDECLVYIITNDNSSTNIHLLLAGVNTTNVRYLTTGFNSVWIRDYGPWTVYLDKVAARGISDYLYNRPNRDLDDQIPYQVADYLSTPIYNADENPYQWTHSGGNFLRDGVRTAYSSDLVLRENSGKTGRQIAEYANVFFGIEDYRILSRLNYDTIHHLDMHMRTLDEETIAIGEYPPGVADGPVIESNLRWLRNHYRTPYGKTYRILRLPMPPAAAGQYPPMGDYRTYTNSVFVNNTILVPTYAAPTDSMALQLYEGYFPGYRVAGINCNEIIDELGALHCITKLVGVEAPLLIEHPRLRDVYENVNTYSIEAWLYHASGIAQASVYYRTDAAAAYEELSLQPDPDDPDRWTTVIPAQAPGTEIQYYIEAFAQNGKRQVRPLPAPEGYYHFTVKSWEQAPVANWVQNNREIAAGTEVLYTNDSRNGVTSTLWSFPGGEPVYALSNEVKVTYEEAGDYAVRLVVGNPEGSDTLLRPAGLRVREPQLPFAENFAALEGSPWEVINPDNGNVRWQWRADGGCAGACLEVPHRQAPAKLNREFLRTAIDLRGYDLPRMDFQVAYAQRHPQHFDELRINLVDQRGNHLNIYNKGGDVLATLPDYIPGFVPTSCAEWRTESIDLSEWAGQRFILEFESIGDRGNSIFLDEINLVANALPVAEITFPANNTLYIGAGAPIGQTMRVSATDSDGTIAQVDFFLGNTYLGSATDEPYEMPYVLPTWGDYTLQARATDDQGSLAWTETVEVRYDLNNSLTTLGDLPVEVRLSPSPATDATALLLQSDMTLNGLQATLYTTAGEQLTQWQLNAPQGKSRHPLQLTAYPAGTYWLRLNYEREQLTLPVVKL